MPFSESGMDISLVEKFRKAVEDVKKLKQKPHEDELLEIYSLYKQAEFGDCNICKFPNIWKVSCNF